MKSRIPAVWPSQARRPRKALTPVGGGSVTHPFGLMRTTRGDVGMHNKTYKPNARRAEMGWSHE